MRRTFVKTLLAASVVAAFSGIAYAQQGKPVKIGLLATLEGPFAAGGGVYLRGGYGKLTPQGQCTIYGGPCSRFGAATGALGLRAASRATRAAAASSLTRSHFDSRMRSANATCSWASWCASS